MPIYAFACEHCGHHFDRLQKLSDPDPDTCPSCGKTGVRRQLTAPQFRLAGGGWYETDFKKDGDKKRNLVDKSDGGDASGAKPDARPDAKPDGKSETKAEAKPAAPVPAPAKPADSKPGAT
jgi:putative FmdB family regulatory protein